MNDQTLQDAGALDDAGQGKQRHAPIDGDQISTTSHSDAQPPQTNPDDALFDPEAFGI